MVFGFDKIVLLSVIFYFSLLCQIILVFKILQTIYNFSFRIIFQYSQLLYVVPAVSIVIIGEWCDDTLFINTIYFYLSYETSIFMWEESTYHQHYHFSSSYCLLTLFLLWLELTIDGIISKSMRRYYFVTPNMKHYYFLVPYLWHQLYMQVIQTLIYFLYHKNAIKWKNRTNVWRDI